VIASKPSWRASLIGLSIAYLFFQLAFLDQLPIIAVDEPWYANTAHNLANGQGLINTNVGERGGDEFFLYTFVLAGAFKVLGTSLWVGRFVSVILGLISLWGWGLLCRKLEIRGWAFVITGSLFITSNVYFILFRRVRPEALVLALSVWALCFFVEAWQTRRVSAAFACALLAGGSALAHPNGALLALLFGGLLATRAIADRRGAEAFLGYATGGVGIVLLFLLGWALLREESLSEFFKSALIDSRRLSVTEGSVFSASWTNLSTFLPAYSLGFRRVYILIFELGILVMGLARYRHDRLTGILSVAALLWFVAGLALFIPFFRWAFCIVVMFSLAVTGRLLSLGVTAISPAVPRLLMVLTLLYGLNNLAGDAHVLRQQAANTPYTQLSEALDAMIPDGSPVLTHLELWFAFKKNPAYSAFTRWSSTPYAGFSEFLGSGDVRYAVLTDSFIQGRSPTTGERETLYAGTRHGAFYRAARTYAATHGKLIAVLPTRGYGEIEIWECR
jgi:Dolichyl-phosphate-mannose-protein mannosyltransferase